ncbi:MAG: DUF3616 domain-containing protein [Acidobacteria bacterium]|nr:DUF3616 domain-containing protein [Acidobacteriota bacterium]
MPCPITTYTFVLDKTPKLIEDLSAVLITGDNLWLGSDEGTAITRLTRTAPDRFEKEKPVDLKTELALPGSDEIDIEGLAQSAGFLWLTGSHSLKRSKAKVGTLPDKVAGKLAEVKPEETVNRFTLARFAVSADTEGMELSAPVKLPHSGQSNALGAALAGDPHLGRFKDIPSKDNGLDIEGMAVIGNKVFLGLRGPVLRGWSVVLELTVSVAGTDLKLDTAPAKHFLPLGGLGIRDLEVDGADLLILAGPTMDLDGPVKVFRWAGFPAPAAPPVLTEVLNVPFGTGTDHAEAITLLPQVDGRKRLLVVYDSPSPSRLVGANGVRADVFELSA